MSIAAATSSLESRRWQGLACALAGAVAFSGKAIVAKLLYRHGADAFAVVGLRMAMALPLFLLMAWWSGRGQAAAPEQRGPQVWGATQVWQVIGLGFCGYYLASTLDFLGLQYISASLERAILYLNPSIVLLLSVVLLGQRLRPLQLAAMALSYGGVLIVFLHDWDVATLVSSAADGDDAISAVLTGSVLVFFSAVSYAIYLMGSGQLVQSLGSLRLVGWASCAACVMCLLQWAVVCLGTQGRLGAVAHLSWQAWALSALNATVCTALPVWLVMRGVQLLGASLASQVGMVGPLSTIWMAAWWLDEPVSWRLMLGTAAVLAGIVVLSRAARPGPQP
ncbi:MAG: DMT family transporter [Proteobacteria bacterium]|uniref:DMT family transporter n=1 Tax=Aquabacterium sp. TaxID=1872578 RepID=UPI0035C67E28|nr:DMT family transporter [Pseudomonadota bacterium]